MYTRTRSSSDAIFRLLLLVTLAELSLEDHLLLLKELGQVAVLVHRDENIAASHKVLLNVELRDRGPVRVLLDSLSELWVLEDVEGGKLFGVDALKAEDLDRGAGEAALGHLGGSLHEQHHRRRSDRLVDGCPGLVREQARLEGSERGDGGAEEGGRGADGGGPGGLPEEGLE